MKKLLIVLVLALSPFYLIADEEKPVSPMACDQCEQEDCNGCGS